jgi:hypothetical protein
MEDSPSQTHRCFLLLSLMSCAQYTNVPSENAVAISQVPDEHQRGGRVL